MALFTFLYFNFCPNRRIISIPSSVFNLSLYIVLVKVCKENLASYTYITGKEKPWIAFSDNCGYSPLLVHQNSAGGCF